MFPNRGLTSSSKTLLNFQNQINDHGSSNKIDNNSNFNTIKVTLIIAQESQLRPAKHAFVY